MLSILCVILTTKVKVGIPESFKVGWYPLKKTGSSHLKPRAIISKRYMEERSFFFVARKLSMNSGFSVANAAGRKYTDFMPPNKKFSSFRS